MHLYYAEMGRLENRLKQHGRIKDISNDEAILGLTADNYLPEHSKCTRCKYFDRETLTCPAYPEIIPEEYLSGVLTHDTPQGNQVYMTGAFAIREQL
jgi:hypothetical protein